jgi:hypothetical protein
MVMRVALLAFMVALSCPFAHAPALAQTKHLHHHWSHHETRHHEAGLNREYGRARAAITLNVVAIQAGELVISGRAPSPRTAVSADDRFTTTSSRRGRFAFHLFHYPMNCTVTLKTGNLERTAVVANCAASGSQGEAGPAGTRGEAGLAGASGPQGPQGLPGPQGAQGAQGERGAQGPQGPAGARGEPGPGGATGPQGLPGPQGAQGVRGAEGPQGPAGTRGEAGIAGLTGTEGPRGEAGAAGPRGEAGVPGLQIRRVRQACSAGQICSVTCDQNETALNASCPKQAPATLTGDRVVSCGIGNSDAMVAYCTSH